MRHYTNATFSAFQNLCTTADGASIKKSEITIVRTEIVSIVEFILNHRDNIRVKRKKKKRHRTVKADHCNE